MQHPDDWAEWLRSLTNETTERRIARKIGVTHTTVQRWGVTGPPPEKIMALAVRFGGDPVDAAVRAGVITREDVTAMNWAEIVAYAPTDVLTAELDERARQLKVQGVRLERG